MRLAPVLVTSIPRTERSLGFGFAISRSCSARIDGNTDVSKDHIRGPVFGATYRFFELGRTVFEYHKQGKSPAR